MTHKHDWEYFALDKDVSRACNDCHAVESVDVEDMEQQLAQAQQQIERLRARDAEWTESNAYAVTRYAEARALLEEVQEVSGIMIDDAGTIILKPQKADMLSVQSVLRKIRAFLQKQSG